MKIANTPPAAALDRLIAAPLAARSYHDDARSH